MTGFIGALLSWLGGGIADKVLAYLQKQADAQTEEGKRNAEITVAALKAEVEARAAAKEVIIAEQGRWYTAIVRPLLAFPVIIYFWKVIVWDKVLALGTTDPLGGIVAEWSGAVVLAYVGGRSLEKIAATLAERRGKK